MHVWSKTQPVNVKRPKIELATISLSQIFDIFRFRHQKLKILIFRKYMLIKTTFWSYTKKRIYVVSLHTNNIHTKIQSNIFIFRCAMVKKPGKGDEFKNILRQIARSRSYVNPRPCTPIFITRTCRGGSMRPSPRAFRN